MSERILDNKYIIDHLIGIGRTSFMYKAWDIMLQKFVTVKKIHEEYASDPEFARIFRNEAVNTAKMEHENIVRVVNFIEEDGDFYIIMDYVKGVSLEYFLSKTIKLNKPIEPAVGTYMILQILRALDYAHKLKDEVSGELYNIIHQDISTANIVIFFDGRVKLTDFGITKKTGADIKDGEVSAYISPEQAAGAEISPLTDVYSAALILYEILSGEKPYGQRASSSEIVDKALKASVDLGSLMAGGVPEGIVSIISRALQKDPAARYPDAAAMCAELNSALRQMGEKDSALQKKHSHFIQLMLQDEIRAAEIEVQKDLEKKYDTEDKSAMSPFVPPPPAQMSVPEPIEEPAIPELSERSPGIPSIAPRPTPVGNNRREPLKDFMTAPTSPSLDPPKPVEPVSPEPAPTRPAAPSPQPARPAVQPTVGTIRKEESPDFESAEKTSGFEKMVFIGKILLACFFAGFTIYALLD
ncbi:MAG: protein kinase, partial [Elusimicrobia bacterium]|nr:protein kinase [Elusimicrobiota bacterium]